MSKDLFYLHAFDKDVYGLYSRQRMDFRIDPVDSLPEAYGLLADFLSAEYRFDLKKNGIYLAEQVHGSDIFVIDADTTYRDHGIVRRLTEGDGMVTALRKCALAVLTADCLPIFFYDPVKKALGIVHAGYKGTYACIAEDAVDKMMSAFGTRPEDLKVIIGPAIRSCCYSIDSDRAAAFIGSTSFRDGRYFLDLASANIRQLENKGVILDNIMDSGICTSCDRDLFSYRRDGADCGRNISVILCR